MNDGNHSPLKLPFEEALQPSRFLTQITVAGEIELRNRLAEHSNRAFGLALASAKFVLDKGVLQVVFEGGIPAGAKLMKSAGKAIPVLVDGKTNRIIKLGRVASKGRAAVSIGVSTALVVVEAAHMISGYDNAKRLKKVERSVDRLVHAHESQLKARLEAVYRYSKELLHGEAGTLSADDRRELHRQCRDLVEIRARWRDDFRYRLNQVDTAEVGWFRRVFRIGREEAHRKSREAKADEADAALEIIQLMHFSLMLQMTLAGCAGKLEAFRATTLNDEIAAWKSLADFGRQRVRNIAGTSELAEFKEFLGALDELAEFWSPEKWADTSRAALPPAGTLTRTSRSDAVKCVECGVYSKISKAPAKCRKCGAPLTQDVVISSIFLNPPRDGWTVTDYSVVRGISAHEAWQELRELCRQDKLRERSVDGLIPRYFTRSQSEELNLGIL